MIRKDELVLTCVVDRGSFSSLVVYRYNSYRILILFIPKFVIIVNLSYNISNIVYQFNQLIVKGLMIQGSTSKWWLLIDIREQFSYSCT